MPSTRDIDTTAELAIRREGRWVTVRVGVSLELSRWDGVFVGAFDYGTTEDGERVALTEAEAGRAGARALEEVGCE